MRSSRSQPFGNHAQAGDRAAVNAAPHAYIGIPLKAAAVVSVGTYPVSQQVQAAPLQRLADLMVRFGLLKHQVDVATMTR
jgi:hypothetical protein